MTNEVISPWVVVAHDAVKIGLGPLIAGALALIGYRMISRHRIKEEGIKAHRAELIAFAKEFAALNLKYSNHFCEAAVEIEHHVEGTKAREELWKAIEGVGEVTIRMVEMQMHLYVIGFEDLAGHLRTYIKALGELHPITSKAPGERWKRITAADLEKTRGLRKKFLDALKDQITALGSEAT